MTAGERHGLLERAQSDLRGINGVARRLRPGLESSRGALRMDTPIAIGTSAILLSGLAMFVFRWGASFGPHTTNGEWWRLATSMLLPPTTVLFVVDAAAL